MRAMFVALARVERVFIVIDVRRRVDLGPAHLLTQHLLAMEDLEVEDNLTKSPRDDRHYRYHLK